MTKQNSNIFLAIVGVLLVGAIIIFGIKFFSGEDGWICVNGDWQKHGNPTASKPTTVCVDRTIKPPVTPPTEEKMTVKIFFGSTKIDADGRYCERSYPLDRLVVKTDAPAKAALEELLKGPTAGEKTQGFFTSINPDTKINSLTIKDGVAKVDFNETLEKAVGGSCRTSAIRAQITQTLKQFDTVKSVVISINGKSGDQILQP
jgi:spore germination protein GerM